MLDIVPLYPFSLNRQAAEREMTTGVIRPLPLHLLFNTDG